jgi:hypothetical protein
MNIKNVELQTCIHCQHYIPLFDYNDDSINKCGKFGTKNIINGQIHYYAARCREDETKCGKLGKHFAKEPFYELKVVKHNAKKYIWIVPATLSFFAMYFLLFQNIYK